MYKKNAWTQGLLQLEHPDSDWPVTIIKNRPFQSSCRPPFQSDAKCETIVKKMTLYSHANNTRFLNKSFALSDKFWNSEMAF